MTSANLARRIGEIFCGNGLSHDQHVERVRELIERERPDPIERFPELDGTVPLTLFFGSLPDAEEFKLIVQEAKPGLRVERFP